MPQLNAVSRGYMSGIVGTAGHIDHGKTTLVARLTGVDTDRLPEERRRGITIALGFAPLTLPSGQRVGVVDVPGHERFVRTMVAGAAGIDVALMVVAADEGVMPQTREHLEICQLLGVRRGVVALTKADKAGPDLTELARADVEEVVPDTFLASAPIVACSAKTGAGIDELLAAIENALEARPARPGGSRFFLPVDRVFSVRGFGTVVTGTALSGELEVGEEIEVGPSARSVLGRVRSLQEFGRDATRVRAGHRAAVAVANVDAEDVRAGQVLLSAGSARPTRRLSVSLSYLSSRLKSLKTGAKVVLHVGTRATEAGLTLFEVNEVPPGESALATARLAEPIVCLPGQRFILRGFDAPGVAGRTLGGGVILDPEPVRRRRSDRSVSRVLNALATYHRDPLNPEPAAAAFVALTSELGPLGGDEVALARRLGTAPSRLEKLQKKVPGALERISTECRWVASEGLKQVEPWIGAALRQFHEEQPLTESMALGELVSRVGRGLSPGVIDRAARRMVRTKALEGGPSGYRDPSFRPHQGQVDAKAAVLEALVGAGLEPPSPTEMAERLQLPPSELKAALSALAREQNVIHVGKGLYFSRQALDGAQTMLEGLIRTEGPTSTARAKSLFGISRKYLIPLLETFDRLGITMRQGEVRDLRRR